MTGVVGRGVRIDDTVHQTVTSILTYAYGNIDKSTKVFVNRYMTYVVERVDRTTIELPYRKRLRRHLNRWLPHCKYVDIFEVELGNGQVGFGETLKFATWETTTEADASFAMGRNAVELLWNESLGAGLQMALLDAVARTLEVPIHRILGQQVSERTGLSWWAPDMPPDDWIEESERAIEAGYTTIKVKGRPWFDIRAAVEAMSQKLPEWFRIGIDFNETLLDAERALPVLADLESHPQVASFESPIPEDDLDGYLRLNRATTVPLVMHYGTSSKDPTPAPIRALCVNACDGYVGGGSPNQHIEQGEVLRAFDKPFWIQLRGTGISAAFSLHLGAVIEQARWPAITRHQIYIDSLLDGSIDVDEGSAPIPSEPGLGYTLDKDAVERYRVDSPETKPTASTLLKVTWPEEPPMYFSSGNQMLEAAQAGKLPVYKRGVSTTIVQEKGD